MDDPSTDSLRKLAPSWTLAGDEQLLSILQNTHQRLLSKCQEANTQLEQMATALNDASISLQNVNNQFMALSSSQFIESRVYDDDDLSTDEPTIKEPPKSEVPDELTLLKRSISVLENAHEIITILQDSDTETDTDDEMPARLVLKPKDMYASRPLPYIIGSQPWKNKWHAGLLLEDSDSDSSASRVEHDSDQYSQSEPEETQTDQLRPPDTHTTVSNTSSEPPSEQGSVPKPTPSDVASEIARRLGAREPPKIVEREREDEVPSKPTVRKIYRPQDPIKSTIFPDEPPPLSDHSDSQESDIFADLHRSQPYARTRVADDLFGQNENYEKDSDGGDIFSDFANKPVTGPSAKPTSLFDAGPTPHMFDKKTENHHKSNDHRPTDHRRNIVRDDNHRPDDRRQNDDDETRNVYDGDKKSNDEFARGNLEEAEKSVKKPIGGISLFGNKGTESIGAAILKRNQRKSSTSGDESEIESRSESQSSKQITKEKDIFDDLFARSDSKKVTKDKVDIGKDIKTAIQRKSEEKVKDKKIEKPKVDLFTDNLFDDIDDIFSTNIVKMPSKDNTKTKSIFEDDDDLFSEIAAPKPMKIEVASSSSNKKSLFDSDDELFSENIKQAKPVVKPKATPESVEKPKVAERSKLNEAPKTSKDITKSIFDDDEDELFSDVKTNKLNNVTEIQNIIPVSIEKPYDLGKDDENISKNIASTKKSSNVFTSPSLFDDDDDDASDIFAETAKSSNVQNVTATLIKDFVKMPSGTETKIHVDNVDIPSNSVKTDDSEQIVDKYEEVNLNKDSSKPIEINVNKIVNDSETVNILKDESTFVLPVSENVDSKKPISNKNGETNPAKIFDHINKNIRNTEQSSSDTEFSDQEFDDLPPKETNKSINIKSYIVTETKNTEIPTDTHNIFDKTTLEEDIDKLFSKTEHNTETIFKNIDPDFTETTPKDSKKTEQDNKTEKIATKNVETDIFSDILTEPPVFEKPKEPKRSKNVNALFDDDSDDESLFFKKNDPIFEENPEDFTPTQVKIFGLFADVPPDDDFSKISDELDDDMFSALPKPKIPENEHLPLIPDVSFEDGTLSDSKIKKVTENEEIFSELVKDQTKPSAETTEKLNLDNSEDIFRQPTTENIDKSLHEQQKSPTALSDDGQLFKSPTNKTKPTLQDKLNLDLLSDDENLFTSEPKLEKPKQEIPGNKNLEKTPTNKTKPTLQDKPNLDLLLSDDENLFTSEPEKPTLSKQERPGNKNLESNNKSSEEPFISLQNTEIFSENKLLRQSSKSDEDIFKKPVSEAEFLPKPDEMPSLDSKSDQRKVGKLKAGLNINVNALLPGASPKKVKPNDQPDGQILSVAENQNLDPKIQPESEPKIPLNQNTDSKLLKSVTFDGKPESDVLDNKLSKERAKIQVKRRPSTRRARREAVRKSGIDFGEDSTDNSSSLDDPPRKQPDDSKSNETRQKTQAEIVDKSMKLDDTTRQAEIQTSIVEKQSVIESAVVERQTEITEKPTSSRDVKSKIVYILNDEDIFNTPVEKPESMNKTLHNTENLDTNTGVTTLGKVYNKTVTVLENSSKKDTKSSLFGDENDEEIFKAKTAVKKSTIFDSDSEEELFGTSKKEEKREIDRIEVKKEIKREVVKGSLFGDEDDDDDLFGVKTKKIVDQKPQASRSTVKETPKHTEPVFEDPLSMFGDDD